MENIVNSTIALYKAYRKTRCGKRDNPTAMRYRMEAIERTVALSERLQRRDYSFGPYYPFKVYEPKERLVLAIDFEGKVVQHSLCDNVLEPAFSRRFIRDNHEAQDPQVPRAGGLRQDDTRQRRAILRELDGPHLTRQHLPPAAEHGRLFLQLFPGAQTITERRHNSWPKN